jgi:hypothetical protein
MQLRTQSRPVYRLESLTKKQEERKDYAFWEETLGFSEGALAVKVKNKPCIVIFICWTMTVLFDTGSSTGQNLLFSLDKDSTIIAAILSDRPLTPD